MILLTDNTNKQTESTNQQVVCNILKQLVSVIMTGLLTILIDKLLFPTIDWDTNIYFFSVYTATTDNSQYSVLLFSCHLSCARVLWGAELMRKSPVKSYKNSVLTQKNIFLSCLLK